MKRSSRIGMAAGLLLLAAGHGEAFAQKKYGPGVTDTQITIGNSVAYSGPASAFGIHGRVMAAYFQMLNDQGGVNGRKINFITLDNGFSPPKTIEQSRKLVEEHEVLAEAGTVGTPTNVAIQRYLNGKKVPQLFISAGGSRFNDPKEYPWTVPLYPSFEGEAAAFGKYILNTKPDAKIAVLYQNDDFGKDYLKGLKKGLGAKAASMIVAEVSHELSDPTVDSQIVALQASGANTLMQFTTPKFAAQGIRKVASLNWKPTQFLSSPASSIEGVLKPAGVENSVGIITAQFLKQAGDPAWENDKEVQDYVAFIKKYAPNDNPYDFVGVSGYITAQGVAWALQRAGDELTRENILKHATSMNNVRFAMLLPGISLSNSSSSYAPYQSLRLARFDGKGWAVFGEAVDAKVSME